MVQRLCPVWVGYLLVCPLRKLFQNPNKILGHYIGKDMTVLDIGCAMGFFSLPAAEMVGPKGKVICVDLQKKMLKALLKRAHKASLSDRIETRLCNQHSLELTNLVEQVDFAFAAAVIHEVPDPSAFFLQIHKALKPEKKFLVTEPKGHVCEKDFEQTITLANNSGFKTIDRPKHRSCRCVLLIKQ
jgi:ubiquinone/menaquinone biosynthesis C-methylase UbiE